jgi:cytochrome P450
LLDPATAESAVDALIAQNGSVRFMHRIAQKSFTIGDRVFAPGETLAARTVAPSGKPARGGCPFAHGKAPPEAAAEFASDRDQMPFGAGLHKCLGEPFARSLIRHGITALLRRFPQVELVEIPVETGPLPNVTGAAALCCRLEPA